MRQFDARHARALMSNRNTFRLARLFAFPACERSNSRALLNPGAKWILTFALSAPAQLRIGKGSKIEDGVLLVSGMVVAHL